MRGLKLIGMLAVSVLSMILNGWGLSILWGWFIAAKFGLPALGVAEAIGVSSVVGYMTKQVDMTERPFSKVAAVMLMKPFVFLGIGWIVLKFI